jgi:hypothetical protein
MVLRPAARRLELARPCCVILVKSEFEFLVALIAWLSSGLSCDYGLVVGLVLHCDGLRCSVMQSRASELQVF